MIATAGAPVRHEHEPGPPCSTPPAWDTAAIASLRAREYARLDANDEAYLDYTGGGVSAASQLRDHLELLGRDVLGNPHSEHPASLAATELADRTRAAILRFVRASPDEYAVVFTANASAALKLVGEAYPFGERRRLLLTADNHNSVNGIREFARARGAAVDYVPLLVPSLRIASRNVVSALEAGPAHEAGLFAFPAQSNYSGVRHPLGWIGVAQASGWDVLLDAAAYIPTQRLDLSRWHPEFVAVSWYKALGYPTGIGSLIVRHEALARLRRPWFAGGTIGVVSVAEPRHTLAPGVTGFEDGTIDYLGIPAIEIGLRYLETIGIETIGERVQHLTGRMLEGLAGLRHPNGAPRVRVYGPLETRDRGGTIAFNVLAPDGAIADFRAVVAHAGSRRVSVRGGCFCNPGASEAARGITADEMRAMFGLNGSATGDDLRRIFGPKALGAVRASVGIASNERDVERLLEAIETFPAAL
ncbi:MAG TPA: aminotransferase class V-fold PLP-dependent enzyme [Candidatus Limnocylindrales bacterium]|nr:aminotransferase class V-fold PLP-dependent enzyme [Candidatus Limnocylindrales bacterium]